MEIAEYPEVICGAPRCRRPVEVRLVDQATGQRDPLTDGLVLYDVVVDR